MGTKRRKVPRHAAAKITPEAIAAFRAADDARLRRELRLRPWEASPLAAEGTCPWPANSAGAQSWPQAVELRRQLLEACHAD